MEFEEIYRAWFKPVYQYVRRLSGNEHIAEEVTSDTFFKALKSIDRFRGECDMRVWLCQIARNTYYSYLKKNSRLASVDGAELSNIADPGAGVEEKVRAREEARQIREALRELPEQYREVFSWRIFGELSFREIGAIYGKTDNWACVTYHRARKMIQRRLEETGSEE